MRPMPTIAVLRLHPERDADLPLPQYMSAGAAGCDLVAANPLPIVLQPLQRALIPTGLCLAIPDGFEGQVRPRSGLALKRGLGMPNAPGTIDSDYRGELLVPIINFDTAVQTIQRGERIAQLVISPVVQAHFTVVRELTASDRGERGFGSTGG